jgi:hypothetical protein
MSWFVAFFARIALLVVWLATPLVNRAFPGGLAPSTAGAPPLADDDPDLCPRLLYRWKRDRLGLALGRPGISARPSSA